MCELQYDYMASHPRIHHTDRSKNSKLNAIREGYVYSIEISVVFSANADPEFCTALYTKDR
jgi:hypothetical protein